MKTSAEKPSPVSRTLQAKIDGSRQAGIDDMLARTQIDGEAELDEHGEESDDNEEEQTLPNNPQAITQRSSPAPKGGPPTKEDADRASERMAGKHGGGKDHGKRTSAPKGRKAKQAKQSKADVLATMRKHEAARLKREAAAAAKKEAKKASKRMPD